MSPTPRPSLVFAHENPKGRLLEFCMRAKVAPPRVEHVRAGRRRGVALTLELGGRTIETSVHWDADERAAEQLAARALLVELAASEEEGDDRESEWVAEDEAERLRRANPKGELLERLRARRLVPTFDVRPIVTDRGQAFEAAAWVELPSGEVVGGQLRRASAQKLAEQGAALSLLAKLPSVTPARESPPLGLDPRVVLNNLRMGGTVPEYGFVVEQIDGPQHAPRFKMSAFAVLVGGERLHLEPVSVLTKKEGERELAGRLLAALQQACVPEMRK